MSLFRKTLLSLGLAAACCGVAHAEGTTERAILNSTKMVEYLHTVEAQHIQMVLDKIESGQFRRLAPELPVYVVEVLSGTIVYYQGEPGFKGQPAGRLVDDQGSRFGDKALSYGKASRSGWIRMNLGGKSIQAFCKSQYPFVACTLAL